MGEKLGSGAGATVYQGQWQGRTEGGQQKVGQKNRKLFEASYLAMFDRVLSGK